VADGILDRLVHNAHRIEMRGDSMRKKSREAEHIAIALEQENAGRMVDRVNRGRLAIDLQGAAGCHIVVEHQACGQRSVLPVREVESRKLCGPDLVRTFRRQRGGPEGTQIEQRVPPPSHLASLQRGCPVPAAIFRRK
jgi:hypothetical protein